MTERAFSTLVQVGSNDDLVELLTQVQTVA